MITPPVAARIVIRLHASGGRARQVTAAEQRATERALPCPDQEVIDAVRPHEVENGGGRIDRLEHVHGQPLVLELERLGPMLERDQPVEMLVVALRVERGVEGDAALFAAR